jgi:N-acetylmuramoyl-L-alanine amidase
VRQDGDLLGGICNGADDEVLQRLDIGRVDDLRVDGHGHHFAAALHGDLYQAAARLAVHLGIGQRFLRLHQLLLHLLRLREECRHVGRACGLHDGPLAYWSRLGCAGQLKVKPRRHHANLTPVALPACIRVGIVGVLVAASTFVGPSAVAAPANIAGMIVFLDPGHSGANDASISRQVPTGRGDTKDCQASGTSTDDGYPEHTFTWDTTLRIRQALTALGVRTAMSRGDDTGVGPCVDQRAAMANALHPNAILSIHGDGGPPTGRGFHVLYSSPPLNAAQAGPAIQFAQVMRDQLAGSGFVPSTYVGTNGLNPRSDIAGLNLAQFPSILVELGNMKNPADSALMKTPDGRQKYADAVVRGVAGFLGAQPPAPPIP